MDPIVRELLRGYIKSITFESNANEPFTIVDPFAETPPGAGDVAMQALKPKITVTLKDFGPMVIAPGGEPNRDTRDAVKMGAYAVGGIAVIGLVAYLANRKG